MSNQSDKLQKAAEAKFPVTIVNEFNGSRTAYDINESDRNIWLEGVEYGMSIGSAPSKPLSEEDFLKFHSGYYGEVVDNIKQIEHCSFTGEELLEYLQDYALSSPQQSSGVKEWEWVSCEANINWPDCEVLGFDGKDYMIGELGCDAKGNVFVKDEIQELANITHYLIPQPPQTELSLQPKEQ